MEVKRKGSSFQTWSTERKLESVFLFLTGKCNAKCAMCFYADEMNKKEKDLTFDEIKKLSETAGEFNRLWLSGGEPTLREDLPEILEMFYKNNKIKDVNMPSNGLRPDRLVEWVARFRKNCPDCNIAASVSFDGFGDTHDTQRGVPGNFYKAIDTIKQLEDRFKSDGKVITNLATVITKYNVDQVYDFMEWVYGRFHVMAHTIESARGMTREDGVKVLTEQSVRQIHDQVAPVYNAYSKRLEKSLSGIQKPIGRMFYLGLMRFLFNVRASNMDKPTPWPMDCTAGETTLVIDYDGRFRACEMRPPLGHVKDYGYDVSAIMQSDAMKKEIETIGHGGKANCWCTHGCWITSSIVFNPKVMIKEIWKGYRQTRKLSRPLNITEDHLRKLEEKYGLDKEKLHALHVGEN
jgi:MoaA/NifB/PqqE/SkfB family radical SAM enzyme